MTFVMVTALYPLHQAEKIGKAFVEGKAPETADFVKRINIFVVADFDIKIYTLYEMPDDKLLDGLKSIGNRYAGYRDIEGFQYKMEHLLTVQEALPMIGLG
ncbi:MAG: hypothetical protein ACFFFT_18830 [Candidatus Thorarchaeota archaeon]